MFSLLIADANERDCHELESSCRCDAPIHILPTVHNGQDVLTTLEKIKVDILVMDIVLPVLDGLGVLHTIATMQPELQPAVFVYTAFLDTRLLHELQKLHVVYCFVKPMDASYVVQRVLQLMQPETSSLSASTMPISSPVARKKEEMVNEEVTKQIRDVGVPAHLRGYHYLRSAIQYAVEAEDPSSIAITKDVYPLIAEQYNTRPTLVERSIRNAIEVAWTRGNPRVLQSYFGYTMDDYKGKPTNAEFIAVIADRIRMQTLKKT